MSDLYTTNVQEVKDEINSIQSHTVRQDIYQVKLELLQIYFMCYTLYKKEESEEIMKKLVRISGLLKKCADMEKYSDTIDMTKNTDERRRLKSIMKVKKVRSTAPRQKYKKKHDNIKKRVKKNFDGNIK